MHTLCQGFNTGKKHTLQYNVSEMKKETALSFRIAQRLKAELEKVALNEGRSLSQVCEALLAGGLEIYKKQGSQYVQRLLSRRRQDASE